MHHTNCLKYQASAIYKYQIVTHAPTPDYSQTVWTLTLLPRNHQKTPLTMQHALWIRASQSSSSSRWRIVINARHNHSARTTPWETSRCNCQKRAPRGTTSLNKLTPVRPRSWSNKTPSLTSLSIRTQNSICLVCPRLRSKKRQRTNQCSLN